MTMRKPLATLLFFLLCGCHSVQKRTDDAARVSIASPSATVEVMVQQGNGMQPVAPGQPLKSGMKFVVSVKAAQAGFLYLAFQSGNRKPANIVSPTGEKATKLAAGAEKRFPEDGGFFTLDDEVGQETFVAVLTQEPLSEGQLKSLLEEGESPDAPSASSDSERTRDAPPIATTATRAVGDATHMSASDRRIGISRVSFSHIGR